MRGFVHISSFLGCVSHFVGMHNGLTWTRQVLPNGLIVLLYPKPSALTSQFSVAIKYGSNDDADEEAGKAHFVEHILVGGSKKRIKIHHEVERLGGCSSFETSAECTFTTMDVSPNKIVEASKILSGLLFDPEFEADKLELERKVILNEITEIADNPHDKVAETLIKCLYKKHPIRNPTLGTKATVKRLGLEKLEQAHKSQYVPENMVVLLTGKFSKQDVDAILADFKNMPNQNHLHKAQHEFNEGPPTKRSTTKRSGLGQAYLCFGLRTPPAKNPDAVALDLLNGVLGLGESSRLFVELREKRALTYDFNSMNISGLDHGFFTVACAVQAKSLQLTEQIISGELEKLASTPVGEAELEKSKNVIFGDILRAMDNPHELPRLMTDTEVVYADEKGLSRYIKKLVTLSPKEVQATAQRYFQKENYSTATLIPK